MARRAAARNGSQVKAEGAASKRATGGGAAGRSGAGKRRPAARAAAEPLVEFEFDEPQPRRQPVSRATGIAARFSDAGSAVSGVMSGRALPAALIGAGLAWLVLDSSVARRRLSAAARRIEESELFGRARETFEDVSERVSERAATAKESMAEGAGRVGESLYDVAESARQAAARVGEYTQDGARAAAARLREGAAAVGEGARRGFEYSREGATRAWEQHPLTTGLAALATGLAVGLLLPGTRREDEAMGTASDAVSQRVRTAGQSLVDRGREVAASAAEALKQEVDDRRFGNEVTKKVRQMTENVRDATVTTARRLGLDPAEVLPETTPTRSKRSGGGGQNRTRSRKKK